MKDETVLTQQEWNELVMPGYEGATGDGNMIQCLARVPNLLQRCKELLPRTQLSESTFTRLKSEVLSLHQNSQTVIMELCDRLCTINMDSTPIALYAHIHAHYLRIYAMGLATGIILNCILGMLEDDCVRLREELSHHSNEITQLAESAVKYQPLGSAAMILCLSVAWLGAPDQASKERTKSLLFDYEGACLGTTASDLAADLERLEKRFTVQ